MISLLEYPALWQEHRELADKIYPSDAIERAEELYKEIGSVGAYTHSKGVLGIRKHVAEYIERMSHPPSVSLQPLIAPRSSSL